MMPPSCSPAPPPAVLLSRFFCSLVVLLLALLLALLLLLGARLLVLRLHAMLVRVGCALQVGARRIHGGLRRGAGRDAVHAEMLERWQRAAVERSGEGGAAGVGDLGVVEVEPLELRQSSRRRWRRTPA